MTSTLRRSIAVASLALAACGMSAPPAPPAPADPHAGHDHGAPQALFVNGDFEDGTLTGWTVTANRNTGIATFPPTTLSHLNLQTGGTARTSVRSGTTETVIPAGLTAAESLRIPKYGTSAVGVNETGASNNVNSLVQAMTTTNADVDPADGKVHVRFAVAPVLQNPGHTNVQQPYFWVQLRNVTKGTMLFQTFNFANQPGVPWKANAGGSVQYTDWQAFDISPGPAQLAVGDQVEITVLAAGCSLGGHWGEVYVDAFGPALPGLQVAASAPASVNTGAQLTYTFAYSNGGTAAASNVTVTENLPAGTTFASVSAPGAACTTPAVGGTGAVTCNVGTVNPSSGGSFTVTVNVTAAAGSTVSNGNYTIAATGVSPLIGPLVTTGVTSGVTYADLVTTASDGVAAVGWGTTTTYTVTVRNAGPSAANGATLSVPLPANLASMSWACAGSGGATCGAASGSGAIATTANLPSGGQATWTISATVAAGSGSGTVALIAAAATPAGVTDSTPSNNVAADYDQVGTLRTLTVTKAGTGVGSVVSAPAAISCGTACDSQSAVFLDGAAIALTASAGAGNRFLSWTAGPCAGSTSPSCVVPIAADTTVTADFMAGDWLVTGSAPGGNGSVSCTSPVLNGQPSTCAIAPAARHRLTALTDDGADVLGAVSGGAYVLGAVTGDHAVVGAFAANTSATSLAASPAASVAGQPVTFTATASGTAPAGTPAGTVDFTAAGVAIPGCTAVPLVAGAAACTSSALAVGTTSVQAASSGDATWPPATSAPLAHPVGKAATTLALAASANPATYGATPTVTATVQVTAPGSATPTGTVTFAVDGSPAGTATVSAGAASVALPVLGTGTHAVTASYSGDANLTASSAPQLDQAIGQATPAVALASGANPSVAGQPVTWTATVSSPTRTPTGSVTFSIDGAPAATVALDASGQAGFSSTALAVGDHAVSAAYAGDADFGAASASLTQAVGRAATTLALFSAANPLTYGWTSTVAGVVSVTAPGDATPTGSITFSVDGAPIGTVPVAGGQAMIALPVLGAGTHAVTATYTGDASLDGSSAPQVDQVVEMGEALAALDARTTPSVVGQVASWQVTITAAMGTPTGSVTFSLDGIPVATVPLDGAGQAELSSAALAVGSHAVTAEYAGDANFVGATASVTQVVGQAASTVALSLPAASVYGEPVTLAATVSAVAPGAGTPSGTVRFLDGGALIGTAILSGGVATLPTATLAPGSHALTAEYLGDASFAAAADGAASHDVGAAAVQLALAADPTPSAFGEPVTWTVTATAGAPSTAVPQGTVTLSAGGLELGQVVLGPAGQATLASGALPVGLHDVTAALAGGAAFAGAASAPLAQEVVRASTATALASSLPASTYGDPVTLTAGVSAVAPGAGTPSGTVTFRDGGLILGTATLSGGVASITLDALGAGAHDLTAEFAGDGSFEPSATATPEVQSVSRAAATVSVATAPETTVFGQAVTVTVGVTSAAFTPAGQVAVEVDGRVVATLPLDAAGQATFSTAALAVGPHDVVVHYLGAADWDPADSALAVHPVDRAPTAVSLTASPQPSAVGQPVALTATVTAPAPGAGVPTGTVTFLDAGVVIGTGALAADGTATLRLDTLPAGAHDLTVSYDGDGSFLGAATPPGAGTPHAVERGAVVVTVTTDPSPSVAGQPVTITVEVAAAAPAAGVPSGTVTLTDGGATLATLTLQGGTASTTTAGLAVGGHALQAASAGDASFLPGTGQATHAVGQAATATALASSASPSRVGQPVTWTATVSVSAPGAGTPTGTVTFRDGATVLGTATLAADGTATVASAALAAGPHPLTAFYAGDASFGGSSGALAQQVAPAATTLALAASPSPAMFGQAVTLTATVAPVAPGAGTPDGTVTFQDGGTTLGAAALSGGIATLTTGALAAGTHGLAATYAGAVGFEPSAGAASLTVEQGTVTVTVASSRNPSRRGRDVTFTATLASPHAVPGGTVTFTDGEVVLGTAPLAGGVATLTTWDLVKGDHPVRVEYAGAADFAGAAGALPGGQVVENTPPAAGSGAALALGPAAAASAAVAGPVLDQAIGTVELWFRTGWTDAAEVAGPVTLLRLGDAASPRLLVTVAADRQALTAAVGAATASAGPAAADGAWHHLAVVSDGASTTFALDGAPFGGVEASLDAGTGGAVLVGDGFVGEVDELRLWTTARTPAELAAALRRPLAGDEAGLAGLWRMDEGGGAELFDATSAHRTGAVALAAGAAPDAAFAPSGAWAHREVWQERDMEPAHAGYDADGDPLALAVTAPPAHGAAGADATALTVGYRAGPGWLGPDQLAFQLDDGAATSAYQLEIEVHRVLLCAASADCGGGDLCLQGVCVAPSDLSGRAGGCGCTIGGGGAAALWSLLALALASRRRHRR